MLWTLILKDFAITECRQEVFEFHDLQRQDRGRGKAKWLIPGALSWCCGGKAAARRHSRQGSAKKKGFLSLCDRPSLTSKKTCFVSITAKLKSLSAVTWNPVGLARLGLRNRTGATQDAFKSQSSRASRPCVPSRLGAELRACRLRRKTDLKKDRLAASFLCD